MLSPYHFNAFSRCNRPFSIRLAYFEEYLSRYLGKDCYIWYILFNFTILCKIIKTIRSCFILIKEVALVAIP